MSLTSSSLTSESYWSKTMSLNIVCACMAPPHKLRSDDSFAAQFQTSYPRTPSFRKSWVSRQFVKLIIFTGLMGFMIEQYINPIIKNSQRPLKGNLLNAVERVLKLSLPCLYVWLCMFYCFFLLCYLWERSNGNAQIRV